MGLIDDARAYRAQIDAVALQVTPEVALANIGLYKPWDGNGHAYVVGDRPRYSDQLYEVVQAHTSQPDWTPDTTPALYKRIADPAEEWPEWIRPTGAQDAYNTGDKVSHSGKHWISDRDGNVWEPGTPDSGWTEA